MPAVRVFPFTASSQWQVLAIGWSYEPQINTTPRFTALESRLTSIVRYRRRDMATRTTGTPDTCHRQPSSSGTMTTQA